MAGCLGVLPAGYGAKNMSSMSGFSNNSSKDLFVLPSEIANLCPPLFKIKYFSSYPAIQSG
jgi:hypothetical protein